MKKQIFKMVILLCSLLFVCMLITACNVAPSDIVRQPVGDLRTSGDFRYVLFNDNTICITGYIGSDATIIIPEALEGAKVTELATGILDDNPYFDKIITNLSITLPASITKVYGNPFRNYRIREINCSGSLKIVDQALFNQDNGQIICIVGKIDGDYTVPEGTRYISECAFMNQTKMTSVCIPSTVVQIGGQAFRYCVQLREVLLPGTLTTLGENPFYECKKLETIRVNGKSSTCEVIDGVLYADGGKRLVCCPAEWHYKNYTAQSGITAVDKGAFSYCTFLQYVTLPKGLVSVGDYAFYGCSSLIDVDLPDGTRFIGEGAFAFCTQMKSGIVPADVEELGAYAYAGCVKLETLVFLSNKIAVIHSGTFYHCYGLFSFVVPQSVKEIEEQAFYQSDLRDIWFSESINKISYSAFWDCPSLIVHVPKDSYAQRFCSEQGLRYEVMGDTF